MNKLICIGEAFIDFMPEDHDKFAKSPGGAPANVACCVSKLGGNSQFITKVGNDFFGDFLYKAIESVGVQCKSIYRTSKSNTGLAFVYHKEHGERNFLFYRDPSADMLLDESEIEEQWFNEGDILHFCSVDLIDAPVRYAHNRAIKFAKKNNCTICFDPNIRLNLWHDHEEYKKIINEYIKYADILKVSNDELEFITGIKNEELAIKSLLKRVPVVICTKGRDGAAFYNNKVSVYHKGFDIKAIDTTGAGDSFIGSFIYQLLKYKIDIKECADKERIEEMIKFSNAVASIVVSKKGSINVMLSVDDTVTFIEQFNE